MEGMKVEEGRKEANGGRKREEGTKGCMLYK